MSGMLSNIYMSKFDSEINRFISNFNGRYFRYCDDIELKTILKNVLEVPNTEYVIETNI